MRPMNRPTRRAGGLLARLLVVATLMVATTALADQKARRWLPAHVQRDIIVPILQRNGVCQMNPGDIAHLVQQFPDWKYVPQSAFFTASARDPKLACALRDIANELNRLGYVAPLGVASVTSGAPGNGHPYVLADSNFTQEAPEYRARWTDGTQGSHFPSTGTAIKQSPMSRVPSSKGLNMTLWAGPADWVRMVGDTMNNHAFDPNYRDHGFAPGDCAQVVAEMVGLIYMHGEQKADPLNPFYGNNRGVELTSTNNAPLWDRDRKGHYGLHQQQQRSKYGFVNPDAILPPVVICAASPGYADERFQAAGTSRDADGHPVAPEMSLWIHQQ